MGTDVRGARAARGASGLRRGFWTAAALAAPALPLLAGCPGRIDDKARFETPDGRPPADCADVPAVFAERCGGASCHGPGEPAAALDLVTLGIGDRVAGRPALFQRRGRIHKAVVIVPRVIVNVAIVDRRNRMVRQPLTTL
jgi:hypothetical protein